MLDFLDPDLDHQLHKAFLTKRFGENVRELLANLNMPENNPPSIDTIPNEVESDVNVLAPVVEDGILRQFNGGLVVHPQDRRAVIFPSDLLQQPPEPNSLAARRRSRDVLSFTSGEGDDPLFL